MQVKLLYFGEGVTLPKTAITLGVSAVSVWIDGAGYTSASNDLGATGYVLLETEVVDVGQPDAETAMAFQNLHGQLVTFNIAPNTFAKDGGIARVTLTRSIQTAGGLVDRKLDFMANGCKGVSVTSSALTFTVEMLQMAQAVADVSSVIAQDEIVAIADAAPADASVTATA